MKSYKLLFLDMELPYLLKNAKYPLGGACIRQNALAEGLVALGHKVGVLTWKGAKNYIQKDTKFDIVESFALSDGSQKFRWIYHIYPALYKAIESYNPDILFQKCSGMITGVLAFIAKRLGIPFIYMASNDIDADGRYKLRLRPLDVKLYEYGIKNSNQLIVQNKYQKNEFQKKLKNIKISIIHNPFFYEVPLKKIRPINQRKYVAWIGVFQHQKNLPALLEIIKKTPDIEFRIAGTFSRSCPDNIRKVVDDISNCKNVKLVGYLGRNEIIPFLEEALALLNTSLYEGFSNTFLESFAAGAPVITNSINPDNILTDNQIGIVAKNYGEIPKIIKELINKQNYNKMALKCRDYVLKNHEIKKIAEKFMNSVVESL